MRTQAAFIASLLLTACATAPTSPADQTLSGTITTAAPRAAFPLQLEAGQIVTLTTARNSSFDTVLTLNGPGGRAVAENDDVPEGGLNSRIIFAAPATGTYNAIVTGYGGAAGTFELEIDYGLNVGLSDSARTLREERISFSAQSTEHRSTIDLAAGDIFVASTFALASDLDTTLTLLDANGAVLAQNDDRGDGTLNSQIVYQIVEAGTYTIIAGTYGNQGAGGAVLSLAIDPEAEPPYNFAALEGEPIATHEGALSAEQPSREFPLQLAAGQTILALADTVTGDLDPVLRLLDANGDPVALNDDRGDGSLNSAIAFTAPAAGAYTLVLERYRRSDTSGDFRLGVTSVDAFVVATLQALQENAVRLSGPEQVIETTDFRVLYTLEGDDASTEEYARATANALQEIYDIQIRQIGWAEPVRDDNGRYRAYVADADGSMGYTKPVQIVFDNPNTRNVRESNVARTVFVIDNDFAGMNKAAPPPSLMRATATHEFNHVVQFGYDSEEGLGWLYEATASWTETTTVGSDQDATDYVERDFAVPQLCWTTTSEGLDYAQWTLLQSLADVHGPGIGVRLWENARTLDGFETMSHTLAGVGTNIPAALQRWRAQNFARDYDLAPLFSRAVALQATISADGAFTPKAGVEQLGANYIALQLDGARTFTLRGAENLELVGLGVRSGFVQAVPLGREGVFDASAYDYAAIMVFNNAVPEAPGACNAVNYSINVAPTTRGMGRFAYRFSAEHFMPLSTESED